MFITFFAAGGVYPAAWHPQRKRIWHRRGAKEPIAPKQPKHRSSRVEQRFEARHHQYRSVLSWESSPNVQSDIATLLCRKKNY